MQYFFRAGRNIDIYNSPEEVLHGRTKYWYLIYILNFAHICCCSSSHCGVPALKLIVSIDSACSKNKSVTSHIYIFRVMEQTDTNHQHVDLTQLSTRTPFLFCFNISKDPRWWSSQVNLRAANSFQTMSSLL